MQEDQSEVRRNRDKHTLELRKQNREEIFFKRRNLGAERIANEETTALYVIIDEQYRAVAEEAASKSYDKKQIGTFLASLTNSNPSVRLAAIIAVRKIISTQENQQIVQLVIDSGMLPLILQLMREKEFPQIRYQASWIISNIAAGTSVHVQAIVDKSGIEALLEMLEESHYKLNQQAIWALGNIGGDSIKFRDMIIQKNGIAALIKLAEKSSHKSIIQRAAWAISNLCRGQPLPKYEAIKFGISSLARMILSSVLTDDQLSDCLWAISSHSNDGQKSRIQRLVEVDNFVAYLIQICKTNPKPNVHVPALRIIGNISIGNELHTEQIIKGGGLDLLIQLLENPKKTIRKQACWIISNLCAGTASQIRQVLSRQDLFMKLGAMFWGDEIDIRKEICFIFRNMGQVGEKQLVLEVIQSLNITEGVVNLITQDEDANAIEVGLKCLFSLLNVGVQNNGNVILKHLERLPGCLERLEQLQHHNSKEIYNMVVKIFKTYFDLQESLM